MPLLYSSKDKLRVGDIVEVTLSNKLSYGIVCKVLEYEILTSAKEYERLICLKADRSLLQKVIDSFSVREDFLNLDSKALFSSGNISLDSNLAHVKENLDSSLNAQNDKGRHNDASTPMGGGLENFMLKTKAKYLSETSLYSKQTIESEKNQNLDSKNTHVLIRIPREKHNMGQDDILCIGFSGEIPDFGKLKIKHYEVINAKSSNLYFTEFQKFLLDFVCKYYLCSFGMGASIFTLADNRIECSDKQSQKENLDSKDSSLNAQNDEKNQKNIESNFKDSNTPPASPLPQGEGGMAPLSKNKTRHVENKSETSFGHEISLDSKENQNLDSKDSSLNAQNDKGRHNDEITHCKNNHNDKININEVKSQNNERLPSYIQNNTQNTQHKNTPQNLKALSEEQQEILKECRAREISLIFGATGSGKTEIYFHAINDCLQSGKQALFLMPEISLSPQMKARLDSAFPNLSDIWHSGRTKAQKKRILQNLQKGNLKIIAGARSALFLPYSNLGLIIIDEEHDQSYKSSTQPKYNARDLAMYAKSFGIKVILGSATPSAKSYYLAQSASYLSHLKSRFYKSQQEIIYDTSQTMDITPLVLEHVMDTIKNKKQVIIFVPLRANFKILLCLNCQEKIMCPNCSISLSVHNKSNAMICHYCNFTQKIPQVCPKCNMDLLSGFSIGTEEVKNRLQSALKEHGIEANIGIFDRDYITTQNKLEKTLNALNAGELDILIGTQMIAKGHDYHNVALSVVLGIDFMLLAQSYRANEEAFSMMYQVAGRSGRKERGRIILQSRHDKFIASFFGDYRKVIDSELRAREGFYPPFARLALVSFIDKNDENAFDSANEFMDLLSDMQHSDADARNIFIVGICKANVFKIKGKYCYQMLLRSYKNLALQRTLKKALLLFNKVCDVDIDPIV